MITYPSMLLFFLGFREQNIITICPPCITCLANTIFKINFLIFCGLVLISTIMNATINGGFDAKFSGLPVQPGASHSSSVSMNLCIYWILSNIKVNWDAFNSHVYIAATFGKDALDWLTHAMTISVVFCPTKLSYNTIKLSSSPGYMFFKTIFWKLKYHISFILTCIIKTWVNKL